MAWTTIGLALTAAALAVASVMGYALLRYFVVENSSDAVRFLPASSEQRASDLLRTVLSKQEYEVLARRGFLDVSSPTCAQRVYRIPRQPGLVTVFECGRPVKDICVQPVDPLPSGDVVIMHKLMIQASEEDYLATARQFPPLLPNQRYRPLTPTGHRHPYDLTIPIMPDMSTLP